jgi:hypothetical protein
VFLIEFLLSHSIHLPPLLSLVSALLHLTTITSPLTPVTSPLIPTNALPDAGQGGSQEGEGDESSERGVGDEYGK